MAGYRKRSAPSTRTTRRRRTMVTSRTTRRRRMGTSTSVTPMFRGVQERYDGYIRRQFKFHHATWSIPTTPAVGDYYRSLGGFSLGLFGAQFLNLLTMFEQYKVNRITVHYRPQYDYITFNAAQTTNPTVGKEYLAINYDQSSTGPSVPIAALNALNLNAFIADNPRRTVIRQMKPTGIRISWRPYVFEEAQDSGYGANSAQLKFKKLGWIYNKDANNVSGSAQFTGPQIFRYAAGFDTNPSTVWDTWLEFDVSFRNIRNAFS